MLSIDHSKNEQRMLKNAGKAINEHQGPAYLNGRAVTAPNEASSLLRQPLQFAICAAEDQGLRSDMQDSHFFMNIGQDVLAGVFDGHGGSEVAEFACSEFKKRFAPALASKNGDVCATFDQVIDDIQLEIKKHKEWNKQGTTAVISFIDSSANKIYTATVGDSEANIYRKIGEGELASVPLSCVRDWSSKSDKARLDEHHGRPGLVDQWLKTKKPKEIYSHGFDDQGRGIGTNVSRALGDVARTPPVTHKPKITVEILQAGDIVVLASDGLKDFVSEADIVRTIGKNVSEKNALNAVVISKTWTLCNIIRRIIHFIRRCFQKNAAQALVNAALNSKMLGGDNITVVSIEIKAPPKRSEVL